MKQGNTSFKKRNAFMLVIFGVIGIIIIFTLFKLQVLGYDDYQQSVIDQLTVETKVNPLRGIIYDRNGNVLASNKTVWILYLCPKVIKDAEFISKGLSEITGISYETILDKAKKTGYKYQIIANSLDKKVSDKIRTFIAENSLEDEIKLNASAKRYYPYNTLACHALGFTNADGVGIYGLEKYYNNLLEGTNGKYVTAQDARSNEMPFQYSEYLENPDGYNLVTTIDMYIQYHLETQLAEAAIESGAQNRACGIVINPQNGEIYAMATYPAFNLNMPYELDDFSRKKLSVYTENTPEYRNAYLNLLFTMWNNKAVTELYEPGSTFKLITTSVALEEKIADIHSTFTCTGSLKIDGYYRAISCHKRKGHGTLDFEQALQQSCNPAMMTLAMRIGKESFYDYFVKFGYTSKTGIDLPSESGSYYHSIDDFSNVSLAVYSFGQTFKITPIRQITSICTVANGGTTIVPHFLKKITDKNNDTVFEYECKEGQRVVSEEVCETISRILKEGVDGLGGAKNAAVKGYGIAGKTGTSEKKDKYDASGNTSYRISSCMAYAPYDEAQVAVIIMVDEPSIGSAYGSVVAAPYVSKFLELALPYLGIEPQYDETDKEHEQISVENFLGKTPEDAEIILKEQKISYEIVGEGEEIIGQMPQNGSKIYKNSGKVILYTKCGEEYKRISKVPNVIGKSPEEANKILSESGLNIKIKGPVSFSAGQSAKSVKQNPVADTLIESGSTVEIEFIYTDGGE